MIWDTPIRKWDTLFQDIENKGENSLICGSGDPGRIRTCDHRLRRPVLYPAELRGQDG